MNSAAANPMTLLEELQAMILATTGRGIEAVSEAARDLVSLPPQTDFTRPAAATTQIPSRTGTFDNKNEGQRLAGNPETPKQYARSTKGIVS